MKKFLIPLGITLLLYHFAAILFLFWHMLNEDIKKESDGELPPR